MTALADAGVEYLVLRRAVGFKLGGADSRLADFAIFAEAHGADRVTDALAQEWSSGAASAGGCSDRMSMVRCFARWFQALDPTSEVPPAGLLVSPKHRRAPYLYSAADVAALMAAARDLDPPLHAATCETVIGVLAATGMRVGEVLRLDRDDVAWDEATLTVWHTKFNKSRLVPLSPTTLAALAAYDQLRQASASGPVTPALFVAVTGRRLDYHRFRVAFLDVLDTAGIVTRPGARPGRIHDLRHSFAVATVIRWYRDGQDVQAMLPRLSTYLGHVDPASTYWYLSAAPELLSLAAERLEAHMAAVS